MKPYAFKVTGGLKKDLVRVAQKAQERKVPGEDDMVFRITDMIRACIVVDSPS